jgi:hypothetical protein
LKSNVAGLRQKHIEWTAAQVGRIERATEELRSIESQVPAIDNTLDAQIKVLNEQSAAYKLQELYDELQTKASVWQSIDKQLGGNKWCSTRSSTNWPLRDQSRKGLRRI